MNKLYVGVAAAARRIRRVKETSDVYLHNQVSWHMKAHFLQFASGLPDAQLLQQGSTMDLFHGGCMTTH